MSNTLEILRGARSLISDPGRWHRENYCNDARNTFCAYGAINVAAGLVPWEMDGITRGAEDALTEAVQAIAGERIYINQFNDSRTHAEVLAAFDKAIATVEAELAPDPTPTADALLAIHAAGDAVAASIVAEHPHMPLAEVESLCRTELFYAAQDTAEACSLGVVLERA